VKGMGVPLPDSVNQARQPGKGQLRLADWHVESVDSWANHEGRKGQLEGGG